MELKMIKQCFRKLKPVKLVKYLQLIYVYYMRGGWISMWNQLNIIIWFLRLQPIVLKVIIYV